MAEEQVSTMVLDAGSSDDPKRRYNEMLFMIDTCQANSMYTKLYSPNVVATGSSRMGENSYSVTIFP